MNNLDLSTIRIQQSMTSVISKNENKYKALGSGFFIDFNSALYFISAGHLVNERDIRNLWVPFPGSPIVIRVSKMGRYYTTHDTADQEDPIDLAIIQVFENEVPVIRESYSPLNQSNFNRQLYPRVFGAQHFITGYPISKTTFDYKTKKGINAEPVRLLVDSIDEIPRFYVEKGYSLDAHCFFRIKKDVYEGNQKFRLPNTKGMSGCGIYYLPDPYKKVDTPCFQLVGVLTEVDFKRQVAIGIRMEGIVDSF